MQSVRGGGRAGAVGGGAGGRAGDNAAGGLARSGGGGGHLCNTGCRGCLGQRGLALILLPIVVTALAPSQSRGFTSEDVVLDARGLLRRMYGSQ